MDNEDNLNPDMRKGAKKPGASAGRVDPSEDVDALSRQSEDEQDEDEGAEQ